MSKEEKATALYEMAIANRSIGAYELANYQSLQADDILRGNRLMNGLPVYFGIKSRENKYSANYYDNSYCQAELALERLLVAQAANATQSEIERLRGDLERWRYVGD